MNRPRSALLALGLGALLVALLGLRGAVRTDRDRARGGDDQAQPAVGVRAEPRPELAVASPAPPAGPADPAQIVTVEGGVTVTVLPPIARPRAGRALEVSLDIADAAGRPLQGWAGAQMLLVAADGRGRHAGFVEDGSTPGRYSATLPADPALAGPLEVRVLLARSGNLAEPENWTEVTYPLEL
ncbi:MAG TPA: hypothetical protein VL172_03575 [Kofleriaceae bacterium]|nr:hypothetical protein [Kofleriaceae bacterium]